MVSVLAMAELTKVEGPMCSGCRNQPYPSFDIFRLTLNKLYYDRPRMWEILSL